MQNGIGYLPIIAADELGLFNKHLAAGGNQDSKIIVKKFSGGPAMNDGLLSGSIAVGSFGLPALLVAWEKTRGSYDIRGLTPMSMGKYALYSSRPALRSIKDLTENDRIAVTAPTAAQALLFRMAVERAFGKGQANRFNKQLTYLPHPDATIALMSGNASITAYFANDPFTFVMDTNPKLHVVTTSDEILGRPATSGLMASTGKFVRDNPAIANGIVMAIREAEDFLRAEPAKAADIYLKAEPFTLPAEKMAGLIRDNIWSTEPSGVMLYARFMAEIGMLNAVPGKWQDVFHPPVSEEHGD